MLPRTHQLTCAVHFKHPRAQHQLMRTAGMPSANARHALLTQMYARLLSHACSLKLKESKAKGGGLVVEGVSGNAAKSGIKPGDTIIYASSFFGDELWPADKLSFTQTAIQRAPSPVAFVYVSGGSVHLQQQQRCGIA